MNTIFQVALFLHKDDEFSEGIGQVLNAIAEKVQGMVAGGGGYQHGKPNEDDSPTPVFLIVQRNHEDGRLSSCTEYDRSILRSILQDHPLVKRYFLSSLEDGDSAGTEESERYLLQRLLQCSDKS